MNDSAIARCHGAVVDGRDSLTFFFFFFLKRAFCYATPCIASCPRKRRNFLRQNNTIGPFSKMTVDPVAVAEASTFPRNGKKQKKKKTRES